MDIEQIVPDIVFVRVFKHIYTEDGETGIEYVAGFDLWQFPDHIDQASDVMEHPDTKHMFIVSGIVTDTAYETACQAAHAGYMMYSAVHDEVSVIDENDETVESYSMSDLLDDEEIPAERTLH